MTSPWTLVFLIAAQMLLQGALAAPARAAEAGVDAAEVHRGLAAVGSRASDEPALRLERQTHEPSASFRLGAALGAWISATAILTYDLNTPSGDGGDDEAISVDCYDERSAFAHLEASRQVLGLTALQATAAAGVSDAMVSPTLMNRERAGAASRCR
jgi:hypothetical protein